MSRPQINLLAETPPGHAWLEVILDLEPSDFRIEHVHDLRRALARFGKLAQDEVPLTCVARWQPMIVFGMPRTNAASIIESHESSSGDLLAALGELPVRSIRLDEEGVRALSISAMPPLRPRHADKAAYRWGKAFTMAAVGAAAMLLAAPLALVAGLWSTVAKLWAKAGSSRLKWPPWVREAVQRIFTWADHQATLCLADSRKLIAIGLRIPFDGFEQVQKALWTPEVRRALEKRWPGAWGHLLDMWILFLTLIRMMIVVVAASLSSIYQLSHGVALAGFKLSKYLWLGVTSPNRGPIFEDPNDLIFIRTLFVILIYIFSIWMLWD